MPRGRPKGIVSPERAVRCIVCGGDFLTRHSQGKYCSPACRTKGARSNEYRWAKENPDRIKVKTAKSYRKNAESIIARTAAYLKTPSGKIVRQKTDKRARLKHPERVKARQAVNDAIRAGYLVRQPCKECGAPKVDAHHPDYSKYLDVIWLCRKHHLDLHRSNAAREAIEWLDNTSR